MDKQKRAKKIQGILDKLYPNPAITLKHKSPYTLLVAVILSAQCTDLKVNTVTPKLFAVAKKPLLLSEMDVEEIERIIKPLGLASRKAQALKAMAKILVDKHHGQVPQTFEELEKLPGVGHKTAAVVMSQAFGVAAFPVDTHIHRCACRWHLSNGSNVKQTEKDLKEIFPKKYWNKLHLQIIYFGREYCPAKNHDPSKCPICSWI